MSEEFAPYPDISNLFAQRMAEKIAIKNAEGGSAPPPPGTVDPYQLMIKKKQEETAVEADPNTIVKWPSDDVKKLEDYCAKLGIVGFSCGRMHPVAALAMLKDKYGEDYTDVSLNERVPVGYEKRGTPSGYGPNYPYSEAIKRKQILHG